ncbi:MAG: hypothetical protein FJY29_11920 [Betaproteobacteria bacterium]|nr:hypothetical protein [Betaproteobacteria bacterium]
MTLKIKIQFVKLCAAALLSSASSALAQEPLPVPEATSSSESEKNAPEASTPTSSSAEPVSAPSPEGTPGGSTKKSEDPPNSSSTPSASDADTTRANPASVETNPPPAPAEKTESKTTRKVIVERPKSKIEEYGTSLIFSADLGILSVFPSSKLTDYSSKYGLALEGKAMGSVLLNKLILDAGLGWGFFSITGDEPGEPLRDGDGNILTNEDGKDLIFVEKHTIKLSGSLFEVAPGYRIRNDIFAGPVFQFRYPSDLGYDSKVTQSKLGIVMGAQGGYQLFDQDLNTRFVGRMMFTLNDKNWFGLYTMVGVQVGLPFTQPEILTIKETTTQTKEKRIVEYRKREFKIKVTRDLVKILMDNLILFYDDPGTPLLTTETQSFMIDLVQTLTADDMDWGLLKIDTISKQHGRAIRDALVSAGIPTQKIRFGSIIPGPRTTNPPVELGFHNVKDPNKLTEALREAMREMQVRESCEGGECN